MKRKPVFLTMLAVLLAFGMVFAGCDTGGGGSGDGSSGGYDPTGGGDGGGGGGALVGKWDIKDSPGVTPALEFTATGIEINGSSTMYTYTATGTTITFKASTMSAGTADYAINGTELSFSNLNLTAYGTGLNAILNSTYTKRP